MGDEPEAIALGNDPHSRHEELSSRARRKSSNGGSSSYVLKESRRFRFDASVLFVCGRRRRRLQTAVVEQEQLSSDDEQPRRWADNNDHECVRECVPECVTITEVEAESPPIPIEVRSSSGSRDVAGHEIEGDGDSSCCSLGRSSIMASSSTSNCFSGDETSEDEGEGTMWTLDDKKNDDARDTDSLKSLENEIESETATDESWDCSSSSSSGESQSSSAIGSTESINRRAVATQLLLVSSSRRKRSDDSAKSDITVTGGAEMWEKKETMKRQDEDEEEDEPHPQPQQPRWLSGRFSIARISRRLSLGRRGSSSLVTASRMEGTGSFSSPPDNEPASAEGWERPVVEWHRQFESHGASPPTVVEESGMLRGRAAKRERRRQRQRREQQQQQQQTRGRGDEEGEGPPPPSSSSAPSSFSGAEPVLSGEEQSSEDRNVERGLMSSSQRGIKSSFSSGGLDSQSGDADVAGSQSRRSSRSWDEPAAEGGGDGGGSESDNDSESNNGAISRNQGTMTQIVSGEEFVGDGRESRFGDRESRVAGEDATSRGEERQNVGTTTKPLPPNSRNRKVGVGVAAILAKLGSVPAREATLKEGGTTARRGVLIKETAASPKGVKREGGWLRDQSLAVADEGPSEAKWSQKSVRSREGVAPDPGEMEKIIDFMEGGALAVAEVENGREVVFAAATTTLLRGREDDGRRQEVEMDAGGGRRRSSPTAAGEGEADAVGLLSQEQNLRELVFAAETGRQTGGLADEEESGSSERAREAEGAIMKSLAEYKRRQKVRQSPLRVRDRQLSSTVLFGTQGSSSNPTRRYASWIFGWRRDAAGGGSSLSASVKSGESSSLQYTDIPFAPDSIACMVCDDLATGQPLRLPCGHLADKECLFASQLARCNFCSQELGVMALESLAMNEIQEKKIQRARENYEKRMRKWKKKHGAEAYRRLMAQQPSRGEGGGDASINNNRAQKRESLVTVPEIMPRDSAKTVRETESGLRRKQTLGGEEEEEVEQPEFAVRRESYGSGLAEDYSPVGPVGDPEENQQQPQMMQPVGLAPSRSFPKRLKRFICFGFNKDQ